MSRVLIDLDYSQIEYRLLAHFSQEPVLLDAYRTGKDAHTETGKMLGGDRETGKTLNFASVYGSGAGNIARTANVSKEKAQEFLDLYFKRLPCVTAWINRVRWEAKQKQGIYTLMKRWIPIPCIVSNDLSERFKGERLAVNYTIQGSAAEILKLAIIKIRQVGYLPVMTIHDEVLFDVDEQDAETVASKVKSIMENVVSISVPLVADVGIGKNWREAKNG